jgi:hypothetical protein
MDGRADIVQMTRPRQLLRPRAAANDGSSFANENGQAGPGQDDGGRQAVRAGPDNDGVVPDATSSLRY